MQDLATQLVPCRLVVPRPDARPIDMNHVRDLQRSIEIVGLRQPIIVRKKSVFDGLRYVDGYELVAGRHRLTVFQKLDHDVIPAIVMEGDDLMAEIVMYDENYVRLGYTDEQLEIVLPRQKELYQAAHPETKRGGDRKSDNVKSKVQIEPLIGTNGSKPEAFHKERAKAMGRSPATVKRLTRRGEQLGQSVLESLAGTSLSSGVEKDALIRIKGRDEEIFNDLVARAIAGEHVTALHHVLAEPERKRSPNKDRRISASDNVPSTPLPMMDLTAPEHEEAILTVGEAVAEAAFFQETTQEGSPKVSQWEGCEDNVSLPSSIDDAALAANVNAVAGARTALDVFLGRFAGLTLGQRRQCLAGRDLSEVFEACSKL